MNNNNNNKPSSQSEKENAIIGKITFKIIHALFIIYCIISLIYTSYTESKILCEKGELWLYVALQFFINDFISEYKNIIYEKKSKYNMLIFKLHFMYVIFYFIWGVAELNNDCVYKLHDTWLYTLACLTCVYHGITIFINSIIFYFNFCYSGGSGEKNETQQIEQNTNTNNTNNANTNTINNLNAIHSQLPIMNIISDFASFLIPKPNLTKNQELYDLNTLRRMDNPVNNV